jgi:hypothetical protein
MSHKRWVVRPAEIDGQVVDVLVVASATRHPTTGKRVRSHVTISPEAKDNRQYLAILIRECRKGIAHFWRNNL